jgi:hypothetical protein
MNMTAPVYSDLTRKLLEPIGDTIVLGDAYSGAEFSLDMQHRYRLWRIWEPLTCRRLLGWIMLNPSTATHNESDPTVTRCWNRAKQLGYDGFVVVNVFAYRATDPKALPRDMTAVGSLNSLAIDRTADLCETLVAGWGAYTGGRKLSVCRKIVVDQIKHLPLQCLGKTLGGDPKHPLYISYETKLENWT